MKSVQKNWVQLTCENVVLPALVVVVWSFGGIVMASGAVRERLPGWLGADFWGSSKLLNQGVVLGTSNDLYSVQIDEQINMWSRVAQVQKNYGEAHIRLALLYWQKRDYTNSKSELEKAKRLIQESDTLDLAKRLIE